MRFSIQQIKLMRLKNLSPSSSTQIARYVAPEIINVKIAPMMSSNITISITSQNLLAFRNLPT